MASTIRLDPLPARASLRANSEAVFRLGVRRPLARLLGRGRWVPLNGQELRQSTISTLIHSFEPDLIAETGAYLGSSTRFFAGFGAPVVTAEKVPTHFAIARARLRSSANVVICLGDSRSVLHHLAGPEGHARRPFFYLDAHWEEELPLRDELELVWAHWPDALVAIDDFFIPSDPGFGYDDYGPGARIDLEYCATPDDVVAYFPAHASDQETGLRRGTCYLGRGEPARRALSDAADAGLIREARDQVGA